MKPNHEVAQCLHLVQPFWTPPEPFWAEHQHATTMGPMAWTWYHMILMLTHLWYADSNRPLEQNCVLLIENKCLQEKKNGKRKIWAVSGSLKLNTSWGSNLLGTNLYFRSPHTSWGDRIHQRARRQPGWRIDGGRDLQLHSLWSQLREWQSRFTHRFRLTEVRSTRMNERKEANPC